MERQASEWEAAQGGRRASQGSAQSTSVIAAHRALALAFSLLALFGSPSVRATCLDGQPSGTKEAKNSSMVVVGTATEEHLVPDPDDPEGYIFTIYVVQVNEVLKGPAPKSLWVYSENTTSRYPMDLGVPHLLFITTTPMDNFVDNCGNSAPMNEARTTYDEIKRALTTKAAHPMGSL